jgi:II/X family phage/plasmid replication protein
LDSKKAVQVSNGATIQELHITSNKTVGKGNELDYLKSAISTQRYRNSIPRLHSNGTTVDWLSVKGNAALIYPSVYIKAHEIALHTLEKIKRLHGTESPEYAYISRVYSYCLIVGVVRFEQKLKSRFLRRNNLQFWGLSDYSILKPIHQEFLDIDKTVQVNSMTYQSIAETLKEEGVCKSTQAANATASYFFMWLHGERFDLNKTQVQTHRARLRRINIDIAETCDITKHSPVRIKEIKEVEVGFLSIPDWYQNPQLNHLRLVA